MVSLPTFLPGTFALRNGTRADYQRLARFHYLRGTPATFAGVWAVTYADPEDDGAADRVVAVGVLSYPTPRCRGREAFFRTASLRYRDQILFANAHVRTVSRVVVHPQFRSLGLASAVVRACCAGSPTRYTEALAVMARAHPFFERAGMRRVETAGGDEGPVYFIHDKREANGTRPSSSSTTHPR